MGSSLLELVEFGVSGCGGVCRLQGFWGFWFPILLFWYHLFAYAIVFCLLLLSLSTCIWLMGWLMGSWAHGLMGSWAHGLMSSFLLTSSFTALSTSPSHHELSSSQIAHKPPTITLNPITRHEIKN